MHALHTTRYTFITHYSLKFKKLKEYGSNVQKLAEHITVMPEREQRTKHAHILIELMRQIHPNMREGQDYSKKLWDDLYVMTNFDLDVDSPFPPPPKDILGKKPQRVVYNQHLLHYRYYGRHVELLILKALLTQDPDERLAFVSYLAKLMKGFFVVANNKESNFDMESIYEQILKLSEYRLLAEVDTLRTEGLIDSAPKDNNTRHIQTRSNQSRPNNQQNVSNKNSMGMSNNRGGRDNNDRNRDRPNRENNTSRDRDQDRNKRRKR